MPNPASPCALTPPHTSLAAHLHETARGREAGHAYGRQLHVVLHHLRQRKRGMESIQSSNTRAASDELRRSNVQLAAIFSASCGNRKASGARRRPSEWAEGRGYPTGESRVVIESHHSLVSEAVPTPPYTTSHSPTPPFTHSDTRHRLLEHNLSTGCAPARCPFPPEASQIFRSLP